MVELAPARPVPPGDGRRERRRSATVTEIKAAARRLLVAGGWPALSTREIARSVGLSAAAIYRYFPSHGALIDALAADMAGELCGELTAARERASGEPAARAGAVARAFRDWALRHPDEFGLVLGDPRRDGRTRTVHIGTLFAAAEDAGAWAALYGLVAAEVFGYLEPAPGRADVAFERELAKLLPRLADHHGNGSGGSPVRYRWGWGAQDAQ